MNDRQSKIDKVKKLISLAANNSNEEEASSARHQAELLIVAYSITPEELYETPVEAPQYQKIEINIEDIRAQINDIMNDPQIAEILSQYNQKKIEEEEKNLPKPRRILRSVLRGLADKVIRKYF